MRRKTLLVIPLALLVFVHHTHAGPIGSGQPRDADLTQIAALVCADGKILKKASGVWTCGDDAGVGGGTEPSDGDKTDITVTGGTTWTIDNDVVTNAKLANMANSTLKCRTTAGTGDPEDCTATQVRTILNVVDGANVTTTATQTLTNKSLTTPTIADFTNANHVHTDAASGGLLDSYLMKSAGAPNPLTGQLFLDNLGIEFEESDTNPACASGNYSIYADLSEAKFKKCTNGAVTDLDAGGGGGTGDVTGPASAVDNQATRFNGTTGKAIQASSVTISDNGDIVTPGAFTTGSASGNAGTFTFGEGTPPGAAAANTIQFQAPADIETAYDLIMPTLSRSGMLFGNETATNVNQLKFVRFITSASAPSISDDADNGFDSYSVWVETTSNPDVVYICTDPTPGAAVWAPLTNVAQVDKSLQDAANVGRWIGNANSQPNAVIFGVDDGDGNFNETNEGGRGWYYDSALGSVEFVLPAGNLLTDIFSSFAAIWRYAGTEAMRLDGTTLKFNSTWRPLKSVQVQGFEFGSCVYNEAVIAASKPKLGLFTCTDNDNDGFDFDFVTPGNWNAGTVTVTLKALSVNATPSGNIVLSCSGRAVSDGDVIQNKSTTGEQTVTLVLATQYKEENATSAAITINDTPAAGDHLYMHCDVDASGTTANMTDVRIHPVAKVNYTITQLTE